MKTTLRLTLILTLASLAAFSSPRAHVELIQIENMNLFVITTSKVQRGGEVHILYSNGDLVMTPQKIVRRRMVIDFRDVKNGTYTVVLKNGSHVDEFQFEKR